MKKFNSTEKGFTLIELLVVISIIALLSVVVMTSLNDAKGKAKNSAKNSLVREYVNAIELYKSTESSYPDPGDTEWHCLGDKTGGCQEYYARSYNQNFSTTHLDKYISGPPADSQEVIISNYDMSGVAYSCENNCQNYYLIWFLADESSCIQGAKKSSFGSGTSCILSK